MRRGTGKEGRFSRKVNRARHDTVLVIAHFPPLFAQFTKTCFNLQYWSSHEGFTAKKGHRWCDRHADTLTFIDDDLRDSPNPS
jgi:hypothetical protein